MHSRNKGKRGELELADRLCELGMLARRAQQYSGACGNADLVVEGLDLHLECKRTEQVRLADWLEQVGRDARGRPWVIVTRQTRSPWLVIQRLEHWVADSAAAAAAVEVRRRLMDASVQA